MVKEMKVKEMNKNFHKLADQAYLEMKNQGKTTGSWEGRFVSINRPQDFIYFVINAENPQNGNIEVTMGQVKRNGLREVQDECYDIDTEKGFEASLLDIFGKISANIDQYSEQNYEAVFSEHLDMQLKELKMISSDLKPDDPKILPLDEKSQLAEVRDGREPEKVSKQELQDSKSMDELQYEESTQELADLMMEHRPKMGQEYAAMLRYMESMSKQLDMALKELQEVKSQISREHDAEAGRSIGQAESELNQAREQLSTTKLHIVQDAREVVKDFKQMGVRALDKAALKLNIKESLKSVLEKLNSSMAAVDRPIKRIEMIGRELRSAGGHMKNAARTMSGKEQQTVDGGREGRFQAAILAPMRAVQKMLGRLRSTVIAAIGCVERLEQAAGRVRDPEKVPKPEEAKITQQEGETKAPLASGERQDKPVGENRVYLELPHVKKEQFSALTQELKQKGAKFDQEKKQWYVDQKSADSGMFNAYIRTYLTLPPMGKEEFDSVIEQLKQDGAHYDKLQKRWYIDADCDKGKFQAYLDPKPEEAKIPQQKGKPSVLKALQEAKEITAGHEKQADEKVKETGQHHPKIKVEAAL